MFLVAHRKTERFDCPACNQYLLPMVPILWQAEVLFKVILNMQGMPGWQLFVPIGLSLASVFQWTVNGRNEEFDGRLTESITVKTGDAKSWARTVLPIDRGLLVVFNHTHQVVALCLGTCWRWPSQSRTKRNTKRVKQTF